MMKIQNDHVSHERNSKILPLALWGLAIGLITGILGAGGGFLIIPALVLFVKLPMKTAIGTSLVIIAINSIFGFLFSLKQTPLDWKLLLLFTGACNYWYLFRQSFSRKNSEQDLEKNIWLVCAVNGYLYTYKRIILKTISVELNCVQLIPLYIKALKHEFY